MIEDSIASASKIISCPRTQISSPDAIEESDLAVVHFSDTLTFTDGTQPPAPLITQVGVEWNEHSLFVFFRGRFEQLRYSTNLSKELLERKAHALKESADVYEVIIGPKASSTKIYKQFQIAPDGRWFDIDVNTDLGLTNPHWYSGCKCKSFIDDEMKIWSAILELPWQCFGASYDSEYTWNINFYRTMGGQDDKSFLTWSTAGSGSTANPAECFGKILFEFD